MAWYGLSISSHSYNTSYPISFNRIIIDRMISRNFFFRLWSILILIAANSFFLSAAPVHVTGTVTDKDGFPIAGAGVVEAGTSNGAITDLDGKFSIKVNDDSYLEVSCIGFKSKRVAPETNMYIILENDSLFLDETVVVGYGMQKKSNLTGAVASIKTDNIVKSQSANVSNTLIGYVPGIISKQSTGEPGSDNSTIYIRGIATYKGNTSPSYIIDGIERPAEEFQRLNPADIESISVLKDAASAAIFGMRGANGVIVVTTRRGNEGLEIDYTSNISIQSPTRLPEFANSYDFARLYNEFMGEEFYGAEALERFKDGTDPDRYPDTDWYGTVLSKNSVQHNHNISVRGGTEKVKYFLSFGYLNQGGLWDNLNYNKYNVRSNIDIKLTKKTNLSLDLSHRATGKDSGILGSSQVFEQLVRNTPVLVCRYESGEYAVPDSTHPNTLAYLSEEAGYSKTKINSTLVKVELSQDLDFITKGLSLKGVFSYDKYNSFSKTWSVPPQLYKLDQDGNIVPNEKGGASLSQGTWDNSSQEYQAQLSYSNRFGNHNISGLAMFLAHKDSYRTESVKRSSYDSSTMDQLDAGNSTGQTMSGSDYMTARASFVGRINYSYKDRYLGELNLRRDASENFAPEYRWGTFWSASAGWVISEEDFFSKAKEYVSFLKIRGSFGFLGNDDTGGSSYPYYSRFDLYNTKKSHTGNLIDNKGDYVFGDTIVKGLTPGAIANEEATWEKSQKANAAIDLGLFNMVNISADWFIETRSDILGQKSASIPSSFGGSLPLENFGKVRNQGIDIMASFFRKNGDLEYSIGGTFTYARNEIIEIAEAEGTTELMKKTGRPISSYYGYQTDGIFMTQDEIDSYTKQMVAGSSYMTQPGDIKYVNVDDSDKVVNAKDRTYLGYGNIPEIVYGINGSLKWKGFDFSFLLQGAAHVQVYLTGGIVTPFYNGGNIPQFWVDDHWSETNMNSRYPRLANSLHNIPLPSSDIVQTYLYDASYIRLKNIELGWSLPEKWIRKIRMKQVRMYISGGNLLTFTDVPQIDPENTQSEGWTYPQMKSFNAGINIKF